MSHATPTRQQVIADIAKNERQVYRVSRDRYRSNIGVQLRLWGRDKASGGPLRPTTRGIWISMMDIPEVIEALRDAYAVGLQRTGTETHGRANS